MAITQEAAGAARPGAASRRVPVPVTRGGPRAAGCAAQLLLGGPLGLFQLAAVLGFTLTDPTIAGADWLVVAWGLAMSSACAALAPGSLGPGSGRR